MTSISALLALPVLFFLGGPLVMHLLAFCQPDIKFHPAFAPVQIEWNQRISLALDGANQAIEFVPVEQKFAGSRRIRANMGRGRPERRDVCAK